MTISADTNRSDYSGTGATATFTYNFRVYRAQDLLVTVQNTTTGVETTLVLNTDYTVTGVGNTTGSIVLVNASQAWLDSNGYLKSPYDITIRRVVAITQTTDIRNQGSYYPEVIEDALDRATMVDQQQQDAIDRALKFPETEVGGVATQLPAAAERASRFLAFDAEGDPIAATNVSGTTISAFMETVVDDATAADALTTLGFSNYVQTIIDDSDAAAVRTTLGGVPTLTGSETLTNKTLTTPILNGLRCAVTTRTSAYTATTSDYFILCNANSAAFTVTLPAAASNSGLTYIIRKTDSTFNAVTIDANASETIDGSLTTTLNTQNESVVIVCDGTGWNVLERRIPSVWTSFTNFVTWPLNRTFVGFWRRVGDSAEVATAINVTGSVSGGPLQVGIPQGIETDTNKVASTSTLNPLGVGVAVDSGISQVPLYVVYVDNTTVGLMYVQGLSSAPCVLNNVFSNDPFTFGAGDSVLFHYRVPILGWNG